MAPDNRELQRRLLRRIRQSGGRPACFEASLRAALGRVLPRSVVDRADGTVDARVSQHHGPLSDARSHAARRLHQTIHQEPPVKD